MSRQDYINDNDFEGALYRFENTNIRWKKHWWEALETIYSKVKSLARKYILDAENMIVKTVKTFSDTIFSPMLLVIPYVDTADVSSLS